MKYAEPRDLWAEKSRQEALEDLGYPFIRWTWAKATASDEAFSSRLLRSLERAATIRRALRRPSPPSLFIP